MMGKSQNGALLKIFFVVLIFILILSVLLNVYQYYRLYNICGNDYKLSENYMKNHENTFINALSYEGSTSLIAYIKDANNLSKVIEGIKESELYYRAATDFSSNDKLSNRRGGNSEELILGGYVSALESYRTCILKKDLGSFEYNIGQIVGDLELIDNWIEEKSNRKDYSVYTDHDFNKNVYVNLKSKIKSHYFQGFK